MVVSVYAMLVVKVLNFFEANLYQTDLRNSHHHSCFHFEGYYQYLMKCHLISDLKEEGEEVVV